MIDLDCTGLACPGPIMKLTKAMVDLAAGDEVRVTVSDPGFALTRRPGRRRTGTGWSTSRPRDPATWRRCAKAVPHWPPQFRLLAEQDLDGGVLRRPGQTHRRVHHRHGALSMGEEVSIFFTFWGLNALRRPDAPKRDKTALEKVMSVMMPTGADDLPLSTMNFGGAGASMIKKVMHDHKVPDLAELIASASRAVPV